MSGIKFYKNPSKPVNFWKILIVNFAIAISNFWNLMYPQSFFCAEAKIEQQALLEKKVCETGEGAI